MNPLLVEHSFVDRLAYPAAQTVADFQRNLAAIHTRIAQACCRVGRDPDSVRLLPVSKTVDEARIRLSYAAGCHYLDENKVQEAHRKWEALSDLPDLRWSVIGHLQTNKAKLVARLSRDFSPSFQRSKSSCPWSSPNRLRT